MAAEGRVGEVAGAAEVRGEADPAEQLAGVVGLDLAEHQGRLAGVGELAGGADAGGLADVAGAGAGELGAGVGEGGGLSSSTTARTLGP